MGDEEKTIRWFVVAVAAVVISVVIGCTVMYVVNPHEFNCEMSSSSTSAPGCDK